ncbi:MAG: thiamine pyrophosphate-binding protein [Planctomycetota bacterium]
MDPKTTDPAAATEAPGPRPGARAADLLAAELAAAGARFAFGVPGGEVLTLLDALERAGIRFVVARHENAAGFMAEGAARLGGGPGVLLATIGPGVANAVNVCANALQDGVPLVILGGRVALDEDPAFTHQVIDQAALFRPVAKRVFEFRAEGAAATAREIVACALAEPRGPVYVDCPTDEVLALLRTPTAGPSEETTHRPRVTGRSSPPGPAERSAPRWRSSPRGSPRRRGRSSWSGWTRCGPASPTP